MDSLTPQTPDWNGVRSPWHAGHNISARARAPQYLRAPALVSSWLWELNGGVFGSNTLCPVLDPATDLQTRRVQLQGTPVSCIAPLGLHNLPPSSGEDPFACHVRMTPFSLCVDQL